MQIKLKQIATHKFKDILKQDDKKMAKLWNVLSTYGETDINNAGSTTEAGMHKWILIKSLYTIQADKNRFLL